MNLLGHEQSLYLLQHAHNPVNWYPWGDAAFDKAIQDNKPVLVSIGYAACHWCHVMERESFENEAVAAYMNEHFVCIKVDREEHPDVDSMYMDAVQAITGSGGWPLNVFVNHNRMPFYGGTYFPPQPMYNRLSWLQLLQNIVQLWADKQDNIALQAGQIQQILRNASQVSLVNTGLSWDVVHCAAIAESILRQGDAIDGGFGMAPKFPATMAIGYLLEHYHYTKSKPALQQALLSIDKMIHGGIYDQLGGGLARYATDAEWLVPHFEKMLYDNALLIGILCDAYQLTQQPVYKAKAMETIAFLQREMREENGGFYSALDADSEGVEGKFYTWTWEEWQDALGEDYKHVAMYYDVSEEGNWEHTNILHNKMGLDAFCAQEHLSKEGFVRQLEEARERLRLVRSKRVRPATDTKCILSGNALLSIAFIKAFSALEEPGLLPLAEEHMQWMLKTFERNDGSCWHTASNGIARIAAKLDDYAYLIQALLQLASAAANNEYLLKARTITEYVQKYFTDDNKVYFYYSGMQQKDIPVRKIETYDGAVPSSNAVMAHNLQILGLVFEENAYLEQSYKMLQGLSSQCAKYGTSFAYWAQLLQRFVYEWKTVVCTGDGANQHLLEIRKKYLPEAYVLSSRKKIFSIPVLKGKIFTDKTYIFVCTQHECLAPEVELNAVLTKVLR